MLKKLRSPLYLALLIPALLALTDLLAPIDHIFWNTRSKFGSHAASGATVIVSFDDGVHASEKSVPSTSQVADVLDRLASQMPRRIYLDSQLKFGVDRAGDEALARALKRLQPDATLVLRSREIGGLKHKFGPADFDIPPKGTIDEVPIVLSAWDGNFMEFGVSSPYKITIGGKVYPTFAAVLAERFDGLQPSFAPEYLLDLDSVPQLSATKFLRGDFPNGLLTGRTVIVNSSGTAPAIGLYGRGRVHPLALDLAGADALRKPLALALGSYPLLMLFWLMVRTTSRLSRRSYKFVAYAGALAAIFVLPVLLQIVGITIDIGASLLCAIVYGSGRLWQLRVRRVQHTSASGLPNLIALSATSFEVGRDVVVAVIARYEEILATDRKSVV